jgi:hypothetical protein
VVEKQFLLFRRERFLVDDAHLLHDGALATTASTYSMHIYAQAAIQNRSGFEKEFEWEK